MSTESNQPKPIVPETPGKSPVPHYTANQYASHAALVKQTNEWLLDNYRRQLRNTHYVLRDKEQLLAKREQELAEKELHQSKSASLRIISTPLMCNALREL